MYGGLRPPTSTTMVEVAGSIGCGAGGSGGAGAEDATVGGGETGAECQRAATLVDDVEFEVAGDPGVSTNTDQQVANPGVDGEALGALGGEEEANLGEVDAGPARVEAELVEDVGRGGLVGEVEDRGAEAEPDDTSGADEGIGRVHCDHLGDEEVAAVVEAGGADGFEAEDGLVAGGGVLLDPDLDLGQRQGDRGVGGVGFEHPVGPHLGRLEERGPQHRRGEEQVEGEVGGRVVGGRYIDREEVELVEHGVGGRKRVAGGGVADRLVPGCHDR